MWITILIIVLTVVFDQLTKWCATVALKPIPTFTVIENVLHFTYVENRGAAFGMLADNRWVFMILSTVGIGALIAWMFVSKPKSAWIRVGLSFIIGGGIGNMIDRVRLGYVVDMIDCRFINFYVFNVADSFVCVGCAMVALALLVEIIREEKTKKAEKNAK